MQPLSTDGILPTTKWSYRIDTGQIILSPRFKCCICSPIWIITNQLPGCTAADAAKPCIWPVDVRPRQLQRAGRLVNQRQHIVNCGRAVPVDAVEVLGKARVPLIE